VIILSASHEWMLRVPPYRPGRPASNVAGPPLELAAPAGGLIPDLSVPTAGVNGFEPGVMTG
jgi:hypothetical protein